MYVSTVAVVAVRRRSLHPLADQMYGIPEILASINHAFAIPRRDTSPTRSNDLSQWSQWNLDHISAPDPITMEDPLGPAVADVDNTIADFATIGAIDSFIDALPRRARSVLAAHALPYFRSSRHFAVSALVVFATIGMIGILLVALGSVGFGASAWLVAMVGYGANVLLMRTWKRHVIRQYLLRMPPDWVLTPCPICRYDQRGISSTHCPECGCPVRIEPSGSPAIAAG